MTVAVDRAFSADLPGFLILFGLSGAFALAPFLNR
jgi:hypothetical protein